VLPLLILLMGVELGVSFFGVLLPQIQQEFRISASAVALSFSVYHGIRLFINVPAGRWISRSSLPMTLGLGGAITAAGAAIAGIAPSYAVVLLGRVVMGTGSAVFFITSQLWLSKVATPDNKPLLFSYNQIAGLIGAALGPLIGGAVAGLLSWRYALGISVIAGAIALAAGRRLADPTRGRTGAASEPGPRSAATLRLSAVFGPGMIMMALFFFHAGMLSMLFPLFSARAIGLGPAAIGTLLTLGTIWRFGAAVVGGRLAAWFGTRQVVIVSLALMAASVLTLHLADSLSDLVIALTLMSWTNVGGSLVVALVTDVVPEAHWGTALGLNRSMADVGAVLAPILVGHMIDSRGFGAAITLVAACLAGAAVLAAGLTTSRRLHAAPT
jgi:predicted MFS family arabinose efflux permease